MHTNRTTARGGQGRRGFLTMELALVLPILGLVIAGGLELTLLFYARSDVVEASRAGARIATLGTVSAESVEDEVRAVLSPALQRGLEIDYDGGSRSGDVVSVVVRVPMGTAAPDLLWPVGFSLKNRYLVAESRMVRE